ncbi:MAG: HTH-type transcriptional activator IlvY [Woeseiaceae bacterium]
MDQRTTFLFLTLCETLHFGRAADTCNMSTSTLSRSIRQLEDTIGAVLFKRDNRSVSLTREGELLRQYARRSMALWSDFSNQLLAEKRELTGAVTLYGSVTASYSFLFDLLAQTHERHPGIRITLQTGDPEQALPRVQSGEADIAIGAKPAMMPSAIRFQKIATTPLVAICANQAYELASLADRVDDAERWNDTPIILPERGVAREHILKWFRQHKVTPKISAEVAGNEAIVSMVSLGSGLGIVPQIVLDNSPLRDRVSVLTTPTSFEALEVGLFVLDKNRKDRLINAVWHAPDTMNLT